MVFVHCDDISECMPFAPPITKHIFRDNSLCAKTNCAHIGDDKVFPSRERAKAGFSRRAMVFSMISRADLPRIGQISTVTKFDRRLHQ